MIIYLKRLKSSKFVRVKDFPMYGSIGVSAPSLHRESTDSVMIPEGQYDFLACPLPNISAEGSHFSASSFTLCSWVQCFS